MTNLYLQHHGILGQKWGIRRYQNADGSLTNEGRRRQASLDKIVSVSKKKVQENEKALKDHDKMAAEVRKKYANGVPEKEINKTIIELFGTTGKDADIEAQMMDYDDARDAAIDFLAPSTQSLNIHRGTLLSNLGTSRAILDKYENMTIDQMSNKEVKIGQDMIKGENAGLLQSFMLADYSWLKDLNGY